MVFNNFQHFSTSQDSEDYSEDLVYFGLVLRQNPAQLPELVFQDHRLRRRWSVSTADPRMVPSAGSRSLETCRSSGMVRVTAVALQAIYGGYSHFDGEWGSETEWDFGGPVFQTNPNCFAKKWCDMSWFSWNLFNHRTCKSANLNHRAFLLLWDVNWLSTPERSIWIICWNWFDHSKVGSFFVKDFQPEWETERLMSQTHLWQTCLKGRTAPMPWHCLGTALVTFGNYLYCM